MSHSSLAINNGSKREQKGIDCLTFSKKERIKKRREFKAVYDGGKKRVERLFIFYCLDNGLSYHRLGVTASKKVGCAVVRNRIKRIFRETWRKTRIPVEEGKGIDFVLVARRMMRNSPTEVFVKEYCRVLQAEGFIPSCVQNETVM